MKNRLQRNMKDTRDLVHHHCLICGNSSEKIPQLSFHIMDDGSVKTNISCDPSLQSYPDRLHGGIISTVIDAAMTNCLFAKCIVAVTASLSIRFLHPVEIGGTACVRAWIVKESKHLYKLDSELIQNGQVKAKARGKFLQL